jgi:hypothetical protein
MTPASTDVKRKVGNGGHVVNKKAEVLRSAPREMGR